MSQRKETIHALVRHHFPDQDLNVPLKKLLELLGSLVYRPRETKEGSVFPLYRSDIDLAILSSMTLEVRSIEKKNGYLTYLLNSEEFCMRKIQKFIGVTFPVPVGTKPLEGTYCEQLKKMAKYKGRYPRQFMVDFGPKTQEWLQRSFNNNMEPSFYRSWENYDGKFLDFILDHGSIPSLDLVWDRVIDGTISRLYLLGKLAKDLSFQSFKYLVTRDPTFLEKLGNNLALNHHLEVIEYGMNHLEGETRDRYFSHLFILNKKAKIHKYLVSKHKDLLEKNLPKLIKIAPVGGDDTKIAFLVESYPHYFEKDKTIVDIDSQNLRYLAKVGKLGSINFEALYNTYFAHPGVIYTNEISAFLEAASKATGKSTEEIFDSYGFLDHASRIDDLIWRVLFHDYSPEWSEHGWLKLLKAKIDQSMKPRVNKEALIERILDYGGMTPKRQEIVRVEVEKALKAFKQKGKK